MKRRTIFQGKVVQLELVEVVLPDGSRHEYERVGHPGGSAVVAINDRREVCLLEQYRYITDGWVWELPAGKHEAGDDPQQTARRELQEEAGITADQWQALGSIYSSPGIFSEVIHLYLARGLTTAATAHESGELIRIHWTPLHEACEWALSGKLTDAKSVIGLLRAQYCLN